jgi:hypothetical protein
MNQSRIPILPLLIVTEVIETSSLLNPLFVPFLSILSSDSSMPSQTVLIENVSLVVQREFPVSGQWGAEE